MIGMVITPFYPHPWLITGIVTSVTTTGNSSGVPKSIRLGGDSCCSILIFCTVLCILLFLRLSFFFWQLLLFDLDLFITPLVSSNIYNGGTLCINATIASLTCTHTCKNGHCIANSAIFQLFHDENKLIFNEMMMRSTLHYTNMLSWICIVLAH